MSDDGFSRHHEFVSPIADAFRGLWQRIVLSIIVPTAWISFTLLYVAFWAHGFSLVQSVVVVFVSALILLAAMVAMWVSFGVQHARRWVDW